VLGTNPLKYPESEKLPEQTQIKNAMMLSQPGLRYRSRPIKILENLRFSLKADQTLFWL
jgi:hypothetical protein